MKNLMTVDPMTNTLDTTFFDDDPIAPGSYFTFDIRSHTYSEPTTTMDDHPTPVEHPLLDTRQSTIAPS